MALDQPLQPVPVDPFAERPPLRQSVLGLPDPGERVPPLAWPTVLLWVGTLALFALELVGLLVLGWSRWVTVPMGAAVTFLMFSVLHEATHHAVSTSTRTNDAFGHLSVPLVVPWATFPLVKFLHIEHHRNTNEPRTVDPDAWVSEGPSWQRLPRFASIDLYYVAFYARRMAERPRREVVATVATLLGVWAAFGALVAAGHGEALLWGFLVPQRLGIVVLAWWFDYLPHHGLVATQREDKYRATRVRVGGERWMTPLFVYQNYHLVHHLHPSVPFYRYVRAWRRNEQAYLDRGAAVSTWFGRSLTPAEYRTWRRLTEQLDASGAGGAGDPATARRPVFHALRVSAVERTTDEAVVVTFDVPADLADRYRWVQGQHVTLRTVLDGREVRRSYSLIDPAPGPDDDVRCVRVAIKHVAGGVFSSYARRDLAVGDLLDVMTPAGSFHVDLDPARGRHLVAVAAGSGVTPMLSTIATTLAVEPASRMTLVLGNRTTASTMLRDELAALEERYADRLTVHHVLSREPGAALPGRVTPDLVRSLVEAPDEVEAWFLCGPQGMVDDLRDALAATTDAERVLTEVFHPLGGAAAAVEDDVDSAVTVVLDGAETGFGLRSTGSSVLDAALQAGVDAPYSCAGGACGTCRARVVLGRAVMDQNHVLADDEVADGWVLTCQAHPVTDELRVDYDA